MIRVGPLPTTRAGDMFAVILNPSIQYELLPLISVEEVVAPFDRDAALNSRNVLTLAAAAPANSLTSLETVTMSKPHSAALAA